jgi:pyruvate/2-oxoglutarate dehydrogenase complex dihydrolipoamide dehydrogenase (E3) component
MAEDLKPDLCVIGAGPGGLSVAHAAALLGASVVLIEEDKMGGDCLNYGCVPSKSLIAAARIAATAKNAEKFGIRFASTEIDYQKVHAHIQQVITTIAPHDSVERYTKLGVKVLQGHGQFIDAQTVSVGEQKIKAKYFVIASGSKPIIPPIKGLETVQYLTNETIFNLKEKPERLIVIGGGPIGCEIAQAHALLGTSVTLLEIASILSKDDQTLVENLRQQFKQDNIDLLENIKALNLSQQDNKITIQYSQGNLIKEISGSHVFIATGRRANIGKLNLASANIVFNEHAVQVDAHLRTTNKKVFAIGDAIGHAQFTHLANYHASIVIKNTLFKIPAKIKEDFVPWVTYTMPEIAQAGLTEQQARAKNLKIKVVTETFANNDRAQTEHQTEGKIKMITDVKGKILGVSLIAPHAGELIFPWVLATHAGVRLKQMATMIAPYPTLNEINKRVVENYFLPTLSSKWMHALIKLLKILP